MSLLKKIFSKQDKDALRLQKSDAGDNEWVVKKGFSILYIGTKEKCQIFMSQGLTA